MFCIQCGKQIPDNSNYCVYCGEKAFRSALNMSSELEVSSSLQTIDFNLQGMEIRFDSSIREYTVRRKEFLKKILPFIYEQAKIAQNNVNEIIDNANSNKSNRTKIDQCLVSYYNFGLDSIKLIVDSIHMQLLDDEIYCYSKKDIEKLCEQSVKNFGQVLRHFSADLETIIGKTKEIEQARNEERAGRGYWQGGGFGVAGAIKGALTANIMNAGLGIVRTVGDIITDSFDDDKIFEQKYHFITTQPWNQQFLNALILDCKCAFDIYFALISQEKCYKTPDFDQARAKTFCANAKSVADNIKVDLLSRSVHHYPYYLPAYAQLLDLYGISSDVIYLIEYFLSPSEIKQLAKYHCDKLLVQLEKISVNSEKSDESLAILSPYIQLLDNKDSEFACYINELTGSALRRGYSMIEKTAKTSFDGTIHTSTEEKERYEIEMQRFSKYSEINFNTIPIFDAKEAIQELENEQFESEFIRRKISEYVDIVESREDAFSYVGMAFEDVFRKMWPQKPLSMDHIPQKIKDALSALQFGEITTPLAYINLDPENGDACYFFISDYYVLVKCEDNNLECMPFAYATRFIYSLSLEKAYGHPFLEIDGDDFHLSIDQKTYSDIEQNIAIANKLINAIKIPNTGEEIFSEEAKKQPILSTREKLEKKFEELFTGYIPNAWAKECSKSLDEQTYCDIVAQRLSKHGEITPQDIIYFWDNAISKNGRKGKHGVALSDKALLSTDINNANIRYDRINKVTFVSDLSRFGYNYLIIDTIVRDKIKPQKFGGRYDYDQIDIPPAKQLQQLGKFLNYAAFLCQDPGFFIERLKKINQQKRNDNINTAVNNSLNKKIAVLPSESFEQKTENLIAQAKELEATGNIAEAYQYYCDALNQNPQNIAAQEKIKTYEDVLKNGIALVISRPKSFFGSAAKFIVKIDGDITNVIKNGESCTMTIFRGEHVISIDNGLTKSCMGTKTINVSGFEKAPIKYEVRSVGTQGTVSFEKLQ